MKIKPLAATFVAVLLMTSIEPLTAQTKKYSREIEEKIIQVEKNLAGWVQTGSNDRWTLADRMKKYNIKGVSIAVVHDYRIEWARGYGFADVAENRPVTENTLFQAASISKSLNSLGILKLVQQKKLDLNTDINTYLKTWKFPYDEKAQNKKITIAELLSHTAGLTIHGFPGYAKGEALPTLSQILDGQKPANTEPVRSSTDPGTSFDYSGGGITISQVIMMDVTHVPYDVFMQKNVLDPLGMTASSYTQPPPAAKATLLATGYQYDGSEVPGKYHMYPEQAAAGLWTNPTDLCRYIIETQRSYNGESSKVLTPAMTKLRLTTVSGDAALGVFVNSRVTGSTKYFNHNGGNKGFSCTSIGSLDGGNGVVIMMNSDNGALLEEIANSVATVYHWKDYYLPQIKNVVAMDDSVLDKYAGRYESEGTIVTFKKADGGLLLSVYPDVWWNVYFTSERDFFIREYNGGFTFQTGGENNDTWFTFQGKTVKKI
jgi:CubicO group peptidase (beta-lactamase class C family)